MTGTTDLSIEQVRALAELADAQSGAGQIARMILHPNMHKDVRVVTRLVAAGDVLQSTRYILRSGRILTVKEYEELVA